MQVWNVLRGARWKCRTQKIAKNWISGHHRTTLSGYIFATEARIDNRKKNLLLCFLHMSPQYGELRPTSGWDRFGCLGDTSKFQRVSRLRSVTARHCSSGRQPNFAALNRGCHLYSAWAAITLGIGPHSNSLFFSSLNVSRRRLDVYHTSTHDVALVRFWMQTCLKCAACCSLKYTTQNVAKTSPSVHHRTTLCSQLRHVLTMGKCC